MFYDISYNISFYLVKFSIILIEEMEIQKYFEQKKDLHNLLLQYLDSEEDAIEFYENLIYLFETKKISENQKEFKALLQLLTAISKNHHRTSDFFSKIEQILLYFKEAIKQTFSNYQIFKIFKSNKLILLILLTNNMITLDKHAISQLFEQRSPSVTKSCHFFYTELKNLIDEKERKKIENRLLNYDSNIFSNFEENRKNGENESYICQLIRNDSIEEFDLYLNQTNVSHSARINFSVFETNSFLLNKNPTLIEYAVFFGSIQIFQYLRLNNVELKPSLWLYAIHGRNADLIHLLEESQVKPKDKSYQECLEEAIKCHHNEIAQYIQDNFLNDQKIKNDFNKSVLGMSFNYLNYSFLPNEFDSNIIFYYFCRYGYVDFVNDLLKNMDLNVNEKIKISHFFYFC